MLGLLLRVLPFWVREPLLIVGGSLFGVGITIRAAYESHWLMAGLGVLLLAVTAFRVRTVRLAWRARRSTRASAPAPQTGPPAGPGPAPAPAAPKKKEPNAAAQVFVALALVGALVGAVWLAPRITEEGAAAARKPAACDEPEPREKLPKAYARKPEAVTGDELCKALNRSDLARLLGTPGETPNLAYGSNGTSGRDAWEAVAPEARVEFTTYTVSFSATYNRLTVAQYTKVLAPRTLDHRADKVLGRPAVFTSDHLGRISIGGSASGGPVMEGPLARTLTVALDRKDPGGSFDLTVWSESGAVLPDDSVLLALAEKVLPALPGRPG